MWCGLECLHPLICRGLNYQCCRILPCRLPWKNAFKYFTCGAGTSLIDVVELVTPGEYSGVFSSLFCGEHKDSLPLNRVSKSKGVMRIIICLLFVGMLLHFGSISCEPGEPVVVVANSIDSSLNSDFITGLESERDVIVVHPSEFDLYRNAVYIVILGGDRAPEGTGELVESIYTGAVSGCVVELNVWRPHQVVVIVAGEDREETKTVCEQNKRRVLSLFTGVDTAYKLLEPDSECLIFLWLTPLISSDLIGPYAPSPLPKTVTKLPHVISYTLEDDMWFFWIDDAPSAKYCHSTRFLFVDCETGQYDLYQEEWWPVLNGESLWTSPDEYWDEKYWVYNSGCAKPLQSTFYTTVKSAVPLYEYTGRGLIINGSSPGEPLLEDMAEDAKGMKEALAKTGARLESVTAFKDAEYTLQQWAREMGSRNALIVYITSHGGRGYILVGGEVFKIDVLVKLLSTFENVHIHVIIDVSCSGALIEPLKYVTDTVITSTGELSPAYGDWDPDSDYNRSDKGSEFTSGLAACIKELARDKTRIEQWKTQASQTNQSWYTLLLIEAFKTAQELDARAVNGYTTPLIWAPEPDIPPQTSQGGGCGCGG